MNPKEVVDELNNLIWGDNAEHEENFSFSFSYRYNTTSEAIFFEDLLLWCSENEERDWVEGMEDYEDLFMFCIKQFSSINSDRQKLCNLINK